MTDIGFINNPPLDPGSQIPGRSAESVQGIGSDARAKAAPGTRPTQVDRVEISSESVELERHLSAMRELPLVREDKVAEARAAIEEGRLDTNAALSAALEVMIREAELL